MELENGKVQTHNQAARSKTTLPSPINNISELMLPDIEQAHSEKKQSASGRVNADLIAPTSIDFSSRIVPATVFSGVGIGIIKASLGSSISLPLAWAGLNFLAVGSGYFFNSAKIFGKSETGEIALWSKISLMPYRMFSLAVLHAASKFDKQPSICKVNDKLYIGRRLLNEEVPQNVEVILDLTSEFSDRPKYRNDPRYRCLAILDGGVPEIAAFKKVLDEISNKCVFIHCAQGSGRTGMTATALLMSRDANITLEQGLEMVKSARPEVRLKASQKNFLERYFT